VTQDLRQLGVAELARSATAMRIGGQPDLIPHRPHLLSVPISPFRAGLHEEIPARRMGNLLARTAASGEQAAATVAPDALPALFHLRRVRRQTFLTRSGEEEHSATLLRRVGEIPIYYR
jgi:hypothetical protein